jgi:hypothetical protein
MKSLLLLLFDKTPRDRVYGLTAFETGMRERGKGNGNGSGIDVSGNSLTARDGSDAAGRYGRYNKQTLR